MNAAQAVLALIVLLLFVSPPAIGARPIVFWASDPVRAGEAVLVTGDGLDSSARVYVAASRSATWKELEPLQARGTSVKFVVPSDVQVASGVRVRIANGEGESRFTLNTPSVYWSQWVLSDDTGERSIRLFGRCISLDGGPRWIRLRSQTGKVVELPSRQADVWSASFPSREIAPGEYGVQLSDGAKLRWFEAGSIRVTGSSVFRTVYETREFNALGDGVADDTAAISRALSAARATGGTVHVAAGRYKVTGTLSVPPGVRLAGDGRESTMIFWPDMADPPRALIKGDTDFEIRDLALYASNYQHLISNDDGGSATKKNVLLANLFIRGNPYRGHLSPEEVAKRFRSQLALSSGGGDVIRLTGEQVHISNCDLSGGGRSVALIGVTAATVTDNRIRNGRWGWYTISGPHGVIFERNTVEGADLMSTGGGINTLGGFNSAKNVYFGQNVFEGLYGLDREAITSDGGIGFFYGGVTLRSPVDMELTDWREGNGRSLPDWKGAGVFILGGKGVGQVRQVISAQPTAGRVTVNLPFDVLPDSTSTVTIVPMQSNFIFYRNRFIDTGVAIQYYGTSLNHIASENLSVRTAGLFNSGRWYQHYQPSWYCQFLDNKIEEGNFYRGGSNNVDLSGEGIIGSFGYQRSPNTAPLAMGAIHRRNMAGLHGFFRFEGTDPRAPGLVDLIVEVPRGMESRVRTDSAIQGVLIRASPD